VSFAPVTYVQTRHTSMFKGSLFGSLTTMNTGKACKFPLLAARKCLDCEVSYHELCAHAANTEGVIKEYQDGCPTCHMDVL
jgi:hypothetical protein